MRSSSGVNGASTSHNAHVLKRNVLARWMERVASTERNISDRRGRGHLCDVNVFLSSLCTGPKQFSSILFRVHNAECYLGLSSRRRQLWNKHPSSRISKAACVFGIEVVFNVSVPSNKNVLGFEWWLGGRSVAGRWYPAFALAQGK